jgi:hypothetical protein
VLECKSIWAILEYLTVWPSWYLPIQTQPFSHAIFAWGLQTVIESMVARIRDARFRPASLSSINNAASLNPDVRAWWGTINQTLKREGLSQDTFRKMLRTPLYVDAHQPVAGHQPFAIRTVRM